MTRIDYRMVLAPVLTGALIAIMWTAPLWSDVPVTEAAITVRVEPQLIGPGSAPAAAQAAGYGVHVEVPGASSGHDVRLDVWSHGGWMTEDEGTTDDRGQVRLVSSSAAFGRIVTEMDGARVDTDVDPASGAPTLYLSEEFDGDALSDLWLKVDQPDDGGTCTTSDVRASSVADGLLALTVDEDAGSSCQRTGQPARQNGHYIYRGAMAYGIVAARIKFPRSRDVTGEFWLQPGDPGLPWAMDDEHEGVVIAGTAGTDGDPRIDTSVHSIVDGAVQASRRVVSSAEAPADGLFHVYSVEWRPDGYTFKIDGETIRTVEAEGPLPPMTVALAMLAPNDRLPSDAEDRTMYVDWLRVWA